MDTQDTRQETLGIRPSAVQCTTHDICRGADPYIFKQNGQWHLLIQEDVDSTPLGHDGIKGYTIRSAGAIKELSHSTPVSLQVASQPSGLKQVWAAEILFDKYMYVAISDGDNVTHRMHVYETEKDVYGPWKYIGQIEAPKEDDRWAIDLTLVKIPRDDGEKSYAVWSGWEKSVVDIPKEELYTKVVPQNIYIAEFISPTKIGPRHLLMSPEGEWCSSVEPILEGPQSLVIDGQFKGIIVTGNASWTDKYATNILKYMGGDPLDQSAWAIRNTPLFADGYGIGHGMIVEEDDTLYYVGHRKTLHEHGWADRMVFYTPLDREAFAAYLNGEKISIFSPTAPIGIEVIEVIEV
jgi:hypothetical protein